MADDLQFWWVTGFCPVTGAMVKHAIRAQGADAAKAEWMRAHPEGVVNIAERLVSRDESGVSIPLRIPRRSHV